jgi:hypothetical protein
MCKKLTCILCFVLIISTKGLVNANDTTKNVLKHYIGINLGSTTAIGLSYKYWPSRYGIQVTFLPLSEKEKIMISAGLTGLYLFKEFEGAYLFTYLSTHFTNMYSDGENFYTKKYNFHIGFGPGIEVREDWIGLHFMIGYGLYNVGRNNMMTRPAVEIGIYFRIASFN